MLEPVCLTPAHQRTLGNINPSVKQWAQTFLKLKPPESHFNQIKHSCSESTLVDHFWKLFSFNNPSPTAKRIDVSGFWTEGAVGTKLASPAVFIVGVRIHLRSDSLLIPQIDPPSFPKQHEKVKQKGSQLITDSGACHDACLYFDWVGLEFGLDMK